MKVQPRNPRDRCEHSQVMDLMEAFYTAVEEREMIPDYAGEVPFLTMEQMIEVDRAMMEDFKIELIQMMENAGRPFAIVARERFLGSDPRGRPTRHGARRHRG